jgi:hypothetical protein
MGQRTGRLLAALVALGIDTEVGDDGLHAGRFDPRVEACITAPPPPAGMRWTIVTAWLLLGVAALLIAVAALRRRGRGA